MKNKKMIQVKESLEKEIETSLYKLFDLKNEVNLQQTQKDFDGVYTFVVFQLVKIVKKKPEEIANQIGEYLIKNSEIVSSFNVVKGFLNLSIKEDLWFKWFLSINTEEIADPKNKKVLIEFSSPNTNKPLHLGHLRNNFLGDSISKILSQAGFEVNKVCLVNDRGIHISKSMIAYQRYGNGETPESSGLKGDHLVGKYYVLYEQTFKAEVATLVEEGVDIETAKRKASIFQEAQKMLLDWENGNKEVIDLWRKMNNWVYQGFDKTYSDINITFDKFYYESDTYLLGKEEVNKGLNENIFFKKPDNSVWIDLTEEDLDEKLVLRGDGTSVYVTQDLGTTELKYKDFNFDDSIWVVGNEQDYHFNVLFSIFSKLKKPYADFCFHLSYGLVDLPSGRMKSREGTVVDADQLIEEMLLTAEKSTQERGKIDDFSKSEAQNLFRILGVGALKYFLLKVDPKKKMLFIPEESIDFQGNTGPFIQYTYARIRSILRKVENSTDIQKVQLNEHEKDLTFILSEFPDQIQKAAKDLAPSVVANYVFELAKTFNSYYASTPILTEDEFMSFRIELLQKVAQTIQKCMFLLGIEVPERM